ncbi:O-6-methylguanine DNA methyltransferase [Marinitoga piezophila KA3]|uniref:Methylated-DNA--protein-cysteine methyltransferase n=1 Tax=Marinitoga piezophila (strain DSM 14283 / JCM 11233 / KA3) TaxID=443254 RepID=H2J824_MARPK|nr:MULTISPECIES: MGMT family protein [Marinitoga]AEX85515.1 O-6-methylguanine DNA methyltransferase [Marinitoga piezophila KA3]
MEIFVITTEAGSIKGFVKNNKIIEIKFYNDYLEEYYDNHTALFYKTIKKYFKGYDVLDELPYEKYFKTVFEERVMKTLKNKVLFGHVVSYGELAVMAGYPRAARAVGTVMAHNNLPLIFPCHRVIKSDGRIGNFGPGQHWKEFLLKIEKYIV